MYKNIQSSIICNSKTLASIQIFSYSGISCVYSNNGIFHSKEYVQVTATCNNRHRSQKHRAKAVNIGQNKSSLLEQNTVYSIRYKFQKVGKIILFKGIGLSA